MDESIIQGTKAEKEVRRSPRIAAMQSRSASRTSSSSGSLVTVGSNDRGVKVKQMAYWTSSSSAEFTNCSLFSLDDQIDCPNNNISSSVQRKNRWLTTNKMENIWNVTSCHHRCLFKTSSNSNVHEHELNELQIKYKYFNKEFNTLFPQHHK